MAYTTLEDFFGDIVGKARRGQGIETSHISKATGLNEAELGQIESYELIPDDAKIRSLAEVLNLDGDKLIAVAKGWVPDAPNETFQNDQMRVERLILDAGMTVNCYVLMCKNTGSGAIIDPGGEANLILSRIGEMDVSITHILLTHGHGDHVGALEEVAKATDAVVCGCERDFGLMGGRSRLVVEQVDEGWRGVVGNLDISTFGLAGHTPGGLGYYTQPVFFSGDALFAGSLGGARGEAYRSQIDFVQQKVLAQPEDTYIFPGHGPVTSVKQEKAYNPYFV